MPVSKIPDATRTRLEVLSFLEKGDLESAASSLVPSVEASIGSELHHDLEFAMCAVFMAYALSAPKPEE